MTGKSSRRRTDIVPSGPIGPEVERALRLAARGGGLGRAAGLSTVTAAEPGEAESLFRHLPIPAYAVDADSRQVVAVNDAALAFYGHAREAFMRLTLPDLCPARDQAGGSSAAPADEPGVTGPQACVHLTSAGREVTGSTHVRRMTYLGRPALLLTVSQAAAPADRRAPTAPLAVVPRDADATPPSLAETPRLPDRDQFRATVVAALCAAARYGEQAAMLCLDVDGVTAVDEALGRAAGDLVRRLVGERLRAILRGQDMVAEVGGDQFAVLQASVESPASSSALATLIIDEVGAPYEIGGRRFRLGLSVGIARAPEDGSDPDALLQKADMALGRAKAAGRGAVRFFDPCMTRTRQIAADA